MNTRNTSIVTLVSIAIFSLVSLTTSVADDQLRIGNICRLKGQEENSLQGLGIVVGLSGTGDDSIKPTTRALSRLVQLMGGNIAADAQGFPEFDELSDTGNVALVTVTATVPAAGVQQGDKLNCRISAIGGAKSLEGGNLMIAYMLGPRADVEQIYALARGPVVLQDPSTPTTGIIHGGCKMETTIKNQFIADDKITLILDKDLASFSTASDVAFTINALNQSGDSDGLSGSDSFIDANAVDQLHVEVIVPPAYRGSRLVEFVAWIQQEALHNIKKPKRVVLNETEGVIIIGEDVLINPVIIAHKNLSIEAKGGKGGFVGFDPNAPADLRPKLKNLVDALNKLQVPTKDVIAIIRSLDRNGDLYGELIIE